MKKKNPNIIYILCDDLGYGDVSCLNDKSQIKTENIDRLAASGQSFTDAHSSSAVCTPSRYSVLTGRYDFRTRLKEGVFWGYDLPLIEPGRLTVPQLLKDNGYSTHMLGKWHLGVDWKCKDGRYVSEGGDIGENGYDIDLKKAFRGGPCDSGFDSFFGIVASLDMPPYVYLEDRHAVKAEGFDGNTAPFAHNIDGLSVSQEELRKCAPRLGPAARGLRPDTVLNELTRRAEELIENSKDDNEPFFLYLPLNAPHGPVVPSENFVGKSGTEDQYLDFVLEVDSCLGRILDALEKSGSRDDTMIVFTSDNGPEAFMYRRKNVTNHSSAWEFRGAKRDNWDGGHRIPFIVSWPERIQQGQEVHETICLTDFMATAAGIVDSELPDDAGEDSYNLLPLMLNEKYDTPFREATVHHSANGDFAIRKGPWKLLLHPGSGGNAYNDIFWKEYGLESEEDRAAANTAVQLYYRDSEDIAEKKNLYLKHPEIVKELGNLMIDYIDRGRSTPGKYQANDGNENRWEQVKDAIKNLELVQNLES